MDSGTTTKARPRRIARVSCRRSVLDFSHSLRVRSVSKVNGLAAVVFGIRMTADLARVSLRQENYRLAGLWTGLWSYGTELRAGVTSPESNLFTFVLCTSAFAQDRAAPRRHGATGPSVITPNTCNRSVATPGGPGTPGVASGGHRRSVAVVSRRARDYPGSAGKDSRRVNSFSQWWATYRAFPMKGRVR